jgi:hypothetical protein
LRAQTFLRAIIAAISSAVTNKLQRSLYDCHPTGSAGYTMLATVKLKNSAKRKLAASSG